MGVVIRQSIKSTIVTYIGVVIGMVNVLFIYPLALPPEAIGLKDVLIAYSTLLAFLAQMGMSNAVIKFFPYFRDNERKHHGFLSVLLAVPAVGFTIIGTLSLVFKDNIMELFEAKSPLLNQYYYYVLPLTFFWMYITVLETYIKSNMRIAVPALFRELGLKLMAMAITLLYLYKFFNLQGYIILLTFSYSVVLILLVGYAKYLKQWFFPVAVDVQKFNKPMRKEMANYCGWIFVGGSGTLLAEKIELMLLPAISGLSASGIYSLSSYMGTTIEIPRRSVSSITSPLIAEAWKNNDLSKIDELYKKSAITMLVIGMLLFIGIWVNIDTIFAIMPQSQIYNTGKYVVFFVGLGKVFDMATGSNSEILLNSKYYKFNLTAIVFLAIFSIVTNSALIPLYGITGAAMANAVSVFLYNCIKGWYLWYKFRLQPFSLKTLIAIAIGLAVLGLGFALPSLYGNIWSSLFTLAYKSIIITATFSFFVLYFRISEDINNTAGHIMNRLKRLF